jgi:hypothetical protein
MTRSTNIQACFEAKVKSANGIWRAAKYARSAAHPHPEAAQTKQCWWEWRLGVGASPFSKEFAPQSALINEDPNSCPPCAPKLA